VCLRDADMRGTSEEDEDDEYVSEESEGDDEVPDEPDEEEEEEPYEEEIVPQVVVSFWSCRSLQSGNIPSRLGLSRSAALRGAAKPRLLCARRAGSGGRFADVQTKQMRISRLSPAASPAEKLTLRVWCRSQQDIWVQCDECSKWRKMPPGTDESALPDQWYCHMNPDPAMAAQGHAAPQEPDPVRIPTLPPSWSAQARTSRVSFCLSAT